MNTNENFEYFNGSEACLVMGLSNKKGKAADILAKYGLKPAFSRPFGKGDMIFVLKADVYAAREKYGKLIDSENGNINNSNKTRFVPNASVLELMARLEQKLDLLLKELGVTK